MSLGSFVQGAFQGYTFGENVKDRKTERKRNEERFQWERDAQDWRGELQQRERENWRYSDELRGRQRTQWERAEEQRRKEEALQAELDQIRNEGFEDWQRGQDGQPVPENTPQGTVRVPFAASDGTGQAAPAPARATFPGMNVPGLSGPNPNAAPLRFGDDVPRMENRPIRVPLGQAGDDTLAGNMGGDMLLTDIQPVKGTYSEEERRQIEREARAMGMAPDQYIRSVTGERRPANVDRTDDARARRGTGRTGDNSTAKREQKRPAEGRKIRTTAMTPNANSRAAVDYPYNPSSPEARAGIMQPGGERTAPRPPAETPRGMQSPNAMDPSYRAPIFSEIGAPDVSRRAPGGPVSPETITAETGGEAIRDEGALTYGGGAQPRPSAPGMPVDPRAPAGPEAGEPRLQDVRTMRNSLAAYEGAPPNSAGFPEGSANGQFDVDDVEGVRRRVQAGSTTPRPANPDTTDDARAARGTGRASDPAPQPDALVRDVDPNRSAFIQDIQGMMRQGDISSAQNRIAQGLATGEFGPAGSPIARAAGAVGDYFTATPTEGQENAAARRKTAEAIQWYRSDEARALFEQNPDALTAAAADPIAFLEQQAGTGQAQGQPQGEPQPGQGAASAAEPPRQPGAPQGGGVGQPVYGGMTASQAAQFQDLPEPRMAIEDGGQPISVARDSLSSNANADNQGQAPQVSDQQRAQAAATFREYYQAEVVPRQIEALYQAGEIEKAEQLQTWFEDKRSQSLQKAYTDAVAAAALGDERGFFDNIGKVYNSFDDGYRFIADESDLYKNEAGATIAKVTLENTATGERFTQEYEGGEELIQQVLTQMDPISVFEQLRGQAEAEAAAAAEQQDWEIGLVRKRIEAGVETGEDRGAIVKDVMTELMKNPSFAQKSAEEQAIELENWMRLYDLASRGTASPQAPVYLGD